jgi:hypothetical protein
MAKSKWDQVKSKLHLVEKWARDGLREDQICKNLGISVTTLEVYKKQYPEVVKALKKGKETLITELENALIKKALGYEYEEKKVYTKTENGNSVTYCIRRINSATVSQNECHTFRKISATEFALVVPLE